MTEFFDGLETRDPAEREAALFATLPEFLARAMAAVAAVTLNLQKLS